MYHYGGIQTPNDSAGTERVTSGMGQSGMNLWDEELDMLFVENASAANLQQQQQSQALARPSTLTAGDAFVLQPGLAAQGTLTATPPDSLRQVPHTGVIGSGDLREVKPYLNTDLPTGKKERKGAKGKKNVADQEEEKKAKRRAAVAAASRATRAKRKRELEDLRDTNKRLEKERERFLDMIAELQMKVQALRETGSIDLRMENDLLRAELTEHKQFISQFKRIADGIPTSKTAKRVMCKQGADTAIAQVLGLASTSSIDTTWRVGKVKEYPNIRVRYQRLPYGTSALQAKRTSVRFDTPFIPMEPEALAEIIWSLWVDQDKMERINRHFGISDMSVKEIDTGLNETMMSSSSSAPAQGCDLIKLFYFRESRPVKRILDDGSNADCPRVTMDTVEVCARKQCQVSASSFSCAEASEAALAPVGGAPSPSPGKRLKAGSDIPELPPLAATTGTISAIVLANTSTQHGAEIEPEKPGIHRIRAAVLEGAIVRKVEGGCSWTSIISHPSREAGMEAGHLIVDADGNVTPAWINSISEIHAIVGEHVSRAVMDRYAEKAGISNSVVEKWKSLLKEHGSNRK